MYGVGVTGDGRQRREDAVHDVGHLHFALPEYVAADNAGQAAAKGRTYGCHRGLCSHHPPVEGSIRWYALESITIYAS